MEFPIEVPIAERKKIVSSVRVTFLRSRVLFQFYIGIMRCLVLLYRLQATKYVSKETAKLRNTY